MTRRPFPQILTMGRDEAEAFIAGPNDVCISISDPQDDEKPQLSPNFRAVLRLEFNDCQGLYDDAGRLPIGCVELSDTQADRIVTFAEAHRHAKRLVVHCAAGISRSVAVAQALSILFAGEWYCPRWFRREWILTRYVHNRRVFAFVEAAHARLIARGADANPQPCLL